MTSTEEEPDALKMYWDRFFKAETGTYEKSTWLELFLAEFIVRLREGQHPKKLINFCPVSAVVSLVGCELLCGIHRVTSSINTHYSVSSHELTVPIPNDVTDNSEVRAEEPCSRPSSAFTRAHAQGPGAVLRAFLLGGVAWRALLLLRALGVEGLSCCRQLGSVLIWVFGEACAGVAVGAGTGEEAGAGAGAASGRSSVYTPLLASPRPPIHKLFSNRVWSKQIVSNVIGSNHSAASSEKSLITGRPRINGRPRSATEQNKRSIEDSKITSDSGDSNDDLQVINKSMTIRVCTTNDDFEYFNSPLRSSSDYPNQSLYSDPFYSPRKMKPRAEDCMTDKHREIINSKISIFEFVMIITDLLQELCKAESSLCGSEGSQISMQCINFSLKNLCSLQFGSLPSSVVYDALEMSRVKVVLTELLMVALDQVLIHSDLCAKLINNGILPMLLRLLEDVICKSGPKYNFKCDKETTGESENKEEALNLIKYIFGIAYSIIAFFHCLLMQCRSVEKLREFTDQFALYAECLKGALLTECVTLALAAGASRVAATLPRALVAGLARLVAAMKRVRGRVLHAAACPRARHKACRARLAAGRRHHHDVLGVANAHPPAHPQPPPPRACAVAALCAELTALLALRHAPARRVLRALLRCGLCCCFPPALLVQTAVRLVLARPALAAPALRLLERAVYGELAAARRLPCAVCERPAERRACPFLIHYNSLLQLDNHNSVLHATVAHLLKVIPKCRTEMKYELLFSVIYPTFIVAKHRYAMKSEQSALFLTVSCLNIFSSLLNTVAFAEQFIQKGGLSYVLELISMPEFSSQCCVILEVSIIVEIFKLIKENEELPYVREVGSLASVQILFKSVSDITEQVMDVFSRRLPVDTYAELCDAGVELQLLGAGTEGVGAEETWVAGEARAMGEARSAGEARVAGEARAQGEVLQRAASFWQCMARLCVHSPVFRAHAAEERVFARCYILLRLLLHADSAAADIASADTAVTAAELKVNLKMVEALLTVQFAVSDVTSGRSKTASCSVLRRALERKLGAVEATAGGGLRALCDTLLAVAAAAPSARHAMPALPPRTLRVPPLYCESGTSSSSSSSSEDSAAPTASENSDPRPDDGYEADIEFSKLEAAACLKSEKLTDSPSIFDEDTYGQHPDHAEHGAGGVVGAAPAHPELCVVVVDILSQLIDKVLSADEGGGGAGVRAGAEATRVCGALARAAAARRPRRLLRRLLAPGAPAARLLATDDPQYAELQRSVVEVICVACVGAAGGGVCAEEARAVLRLLAGARPPLALLLPALRRLSGAAPAATPDVALVFPVPSEPEDFITEEPTASSFAQQAEQTARRLRYSHVRAEVSSCWARGAARAGVCAGAGAGAAAGAGWAPWLHGFSLALWLRREPRAAPAARRARHRARTRRGDGDGDGCGYDETEEWHEDSPAPERRESEPREEPELLHVFSIGHDSLMFELWININTGAMVVRLTRPEAGGVRVVGSARAHTQLPPRAWRCLAAAVADRLARRRTHVQVTLYMNGLECETLSIPVQGILVRKATPSTVILGHAEGAGAGAGAGAGELQLGAVRVYRGPVLGAAAALHVAAHGPDQPCQIPCETADFSSIITPELLELDIDWDSVYEVSSQTLRDLHDNLLLSFAPHSPDVVSLYQQRGGGGGGGGAGGGVWREAPGAVRVVWAGARRLKENRSLPPALLLLGGPELLMYMFARVVELEGSAEQQAEALGVALQTCGRDARLRAALLADALLLLPPVLAAPACRVSHHMLKVILDESFSAPVAVAAGGVLLLLPHARAILLEPRLLLLLMQCWRYFDTDQEVTWEVAGAEGGESGRGSVWVAALAALRVALGGPHRDFNYYQVCRVDLLRHLLLACKERFLNSERAALDGPASRSLVALVRALLGAPPLLAHLALLCDFLLLMHQASDTFVTHSRPNFYFLLTPDTPDSTDFNLLDFISTRRKSRASDNRSYVETVEKSSSSNVSTEDVSTDTDCDKNLKGLINMHIKESRYKLSSASETSDGVTEKSAEETSEGVPEESEFVMVDAPAAAADMYAGVYHHHQRTVRAGAEPGWRACEGLLLLLRDAVAALPDDVFAQAAATAVQAEQLVVLANHGDAGVRAALVRALAALQQRAALPRACCLLLANQLAMYPCSWDLASACATLLTKRELPLEDQLDEEIWAGMDEEAAQRSAPLLALLPGSARAASVPLAHNLAALLRRLLSKASLRALTEVAFVEVVVRAIRTVGHEDTHYEGRDLLLQDLYDLLCKVAIKVLSGNHSTQIIIDIHNMLRYIESKPGQGGRGVQHAARAAQVALYIAQLDYLEVRLRSAHQHTPKTFNYFSTVLPSAERSEATETLSRLGGTLSRAVAFLTGRPPHAPLRPDADFLDRLLAALLGGEGTPSGPQGGAQASRLFGGGAADTGAALSALLWWAASPEPAARPLQPRLLRALYHAPAPALRVLAGARDPDALRKLSVYLLTMVQHVHLAADTAEAGEEAGEEARGVELAITDWARDWAVAAQAELAERVRGEAVAVAAQRYMRAERSRRAQAAATSRQRAAVVKAACAREAMAQRAADAAMAITRRVVEAQNSERKAFLEHLRRARTLHSAARWQPVIDRHTHERGIFHNPRGYPTAWQLDGTEGPGRVRVRLRRAPLRVPPRHLQAAHRHKAEAGAPPLRCVLGGAGAGAGAGAQLAPGEAVAYMARVVRVTVDSEVGGELLLTDRHVHFVPEEGGEGGAARWALGAVARVATRRWCLQERALEVFLCSGRAILLAFADTDERSAFLAHLGRAHLPNRSEPQSLTEATNQWRNGSITNWEYLMVLNDLAGRSYNDLMQYPVFPFIIADYTSKILDLTDPASFRDLSKPMAVQNKNREQHYINTYNDLRVARREGCSALLSRQPHHYASLYSNSGGVLHYLVRLPPFTELFLDYQDNNFDMPDRTFHSLATTWRLITNDSPTDVKELIPELFYLPELFHNNEGLELGVRQCGARIDDVELPRWAPDARLFTLLHRQALEAPYVTENLPAWIDLVFGYKQTGQAAIDAINVFPACTYYGFDPQQLEDELDRTAAAAMVRTYGQAPRQLLRAPHPRRATELQPRRAAPAAPPPPVWPGVAGARWGAYCGSPDLPAPTLVARRAGACAVRVQPLAHPRAAAGCPRNTVLLAVRDGGAEGGVEAEAVVAVTWGHADGAVRARRRGREGGAEALLHVPPRDGVTAAGGWSGAGGWGATGALGFASGRVVALRAGARVSAHPLHAHSAPIADVVLCPPASLLVSASVDGVVVLWDLSELSYIRTLPNRDMLPVQYVAVSETLSDVVTVHEPPPAPHVRPSPPSSGALDEEEYERVAHRCKSLIRVHTVNGQWVGSAAVPEAVTAVCCSGAAEGAHANVVAAALAGGGVRLYCGWALRPLALVRAPPLLHVAYGAGARLLFAACADGSLVAWESAPPADRAPPVRLLPAAALL